jgi:uncharacterized protein YuzE
MKHVHHIVVRENRPPVVELDSEAHAAYVRFSNEKVERTEVVETEGCIVTMDIDAAGQIIGVELVGVYEFTLSALLEKAKLDVPEPMKQRVRYVPTDSLQPT